MDHQAIIGIDVGGTKINIGKIVNNKIVEELNLSTHAFRNEEDIINDIINGIKQVMDPSVTGIGIGVPGLVDEKNGVVLDVLNIPAWKEVQLKRNIESYFHKPTYVSNDANCFALGEKVFGKGQKFKNLVCLTLGTGVGAGIIINNVLYRGLLSMAGEFGGIAYLDHTYEHYCSGKYFTEFYGISSKDMFDRAMEADIKAIRAFDNFGEHLGNLIKTILLSVGPEAIILGGSVSKTFRFFQKAMMDSVQKFPHKRVLDNVVIDVFSHDKIPVMGAAALIINEKYSSQIFVTHEN